MILVAGATGFLGREICRRLLAEGRAVRALVRRTSDPAVVTSLDVMGAEIVEGDLRDRPSLDRACGGTTTVITSASTTRSRQEGESIESTDQRGQLDLVDAARAAWVRHYVYVSYSGAVGVDDPLTVAKRGVERAVRESGITYTILRPTFFMEWLSPALGFDAANGRVTIYGSGENRISWISLADVAEFAVRSIDAPAARNAVIELGGPEALSPLEVVWIFEEVGGRPIQVQHVPEEMIRAQQADAQDSLQRAFAALMLAYASGDTIPMDETLSRFPVRLRSVHEFARDALFAPAGVQPAKPDARPAPAAGERAGSPTDRPEMPAS